MEDDQFPVGLKVLAIDANIVCLKYLVQILNKCRYKVTATTEASEAIRLLKDEKQGFDIIITNVVRSDMDGFDILQIIVGLRMEIPVVMVSANEELKMAKRGLIEGADAYLMKPVSLNELRNVWQHVLRRRSSSYPNFMQKQVQQISYDHKDTINKELDDDINGAISSSTSSKKRRVAWTKALHDKFVAAYEQLEEKERVPNNILKLMNDPTLSRENIASHLQKHRDMLRKNKRSKVGPKNYHVKDSSLRPQFSKLESSSKMESFQGNQNYFPVPEFKWLNNLIPKPCDQFLGFGPQYPVTWETYKYLHPAPPTFGNCPIGPIPDQAPPLPWSFSTNNITSGQFPQMKFDNGESQGNLLMDDEIHELLKQFQGEQPFKV